MDTKYCKIGEMGAHLPPQQTSAPSVLSICKNEAIIESATFENI